MVIYTMYTMSTGIQHHLVNLTYHSTLRYHIRVRRLILGNHRTLLEGLWVMIECCFQPFKRDWVCTIQFGILEKSCKLNFGFSFRFWKREKYNTSLCREH